MSGLLIFRSYLQFYSFVIADDTSYDWTKEDLAAHKGAEILFEQGGVTLEQIDNARGDVSDIVKKLNNRQEVNISKELSSYFT